jgi:membrane-associated phospholipid phosphatase
MVPMTFLISFSRIYNGVHYPADVLVGWIVGMGGAAFVAVAAQSLWASLGRSFAPGCYARMPSLLNPVVRPPESAPC